MNSAISVGEPWMWAAFIGFVLVMLVLDLFVFGGNKAHKVSVREAASWSLVWVSMALRVQRRPVVVSERHRRAGSRRAQGAGISHRLSDREVVVGGQRIHLPADFLLLPRRRRIPAPVLIYGVLGAIVLRAIMILAGAWVVREFSWVLYIFGAFLVVTGMRMLVMADKEPDLEKNPVLKFARRHLRISEGHHGEKFSVMKNGVRYFTPLFLVLILIEASDLVFAVDSIPAIFAITTDPVYRLYLEYLRDHGSARAVLPARRRGRPLPSAEIRPGHGAHLHRREDADRAVVSRAGGSLAGDRRGADQRQRDRQPDRHTQRRALMLQGMNENMLFLRRKPEITMKNNTARALTNNTLLIRFVMGMAAFTLIALIIQLAR